MLQNIISQERLYDYNSLIFVLALVLDILRMKHKLCQTKCDKFDLSMTNQKTINGHYEHNMCLQTKDDVETLSTAC